MEPLLLAINCIWTCGRAYNKTRRWTMKWKRKRARQPF